MTVDPKKDVYSINELLLTRVSDHDVDGPAVHAVRCARAVRAVHDEDAEQHDEEDLQRKHHGDVRVAPPERVLQLHLVHGDQVRRGTEEEFVAPFLRLFTASLSLTSPLLRRRARSRQERAEENGATVAGEEWSILRLKGKEEEKENIASRVSATSTGRVHGPVSNGRPKRR